VETEIPNVKSFQSILNALAKLTEKAVFHFTARGLNISGVDENDMSYLEITLSPSYFISYSHKTDLMFTIETKKLNRVAQLLSSKEKLFLSAGNQGLTIRTLGHWNSNFRFVASDNSFEKPSEIKELDYTVHFSLPASQLFAEIKKASAISEEITLGAIGDDFVISSSSGTYEFETKRRGVKYNSENEIKPCKVTIKSEPIICMNNLVGEDDLVELSFAEGMPLRIILNRAKLIRIVIHLVSSRAMESLERKFEADSLPSFPTTRFFPFLSYVSSIPKGISQNELTSTPFETEGLNYSKIAISLGFAERISGTLKLTRFGNNFLDLYHQNESHAKLMLHEIAEKRCVAYRLVTRELMKRPMTLEALVDQLDAQKLNNMLEDIDRTDLAIMLGLATWCGAINRKLSLYYFGTPFRIVGD